MFSALNVARIETMKKLNLETFEFSQNYTLFCDKLEKSNFFLENIIETLDEALDSRVVSSFNSSSSRRWTMGYVQRYLRKIWFSA